MSSGDVASAGSAAGGGSAHTPPDAAPTAPPGSARGDPRIERLDAAAYTIPTDSPESDGTLAWDSTTLVVVEATSAGERCPGQR